MMQNKTRKFFLSQNNMPEITQKRLKIHRNGEEKEFKKTEFLYFGNLLFNIL